MLEPLISIREEVAFLFRQIGKLEMYDIKQWNNRPDSIIMNFSYVTKRGGNHLFTITFVINDKDISVHQNLNIGGVKTPFELRIALSKAIDLFLEEILSRYLPATYIKALQIPVKYPPSYLDKNSRVKKQKMKKQ